MPKPINTVVMAALLGATIPGITLFANTQRHRTVSNSEQGRRITSKVPPDNSVRSQYAQKRLEQEEWNRQVEACKQQKRKRGDLKLESGCVTTDS